MSEGVANRHRTLRDLALAAEAAFWLTLAGLALRVLSFPQVAALTARRLRRPDRTAREALAARIGWAVDAAALRAPWRALCFERGLAAFFMLRARRQDPVLHYGARNEGARGPSAHVWVRLGDRDVVGCENAEQFALLAAFPTRPGDRADGLASSMARGSGEQIAPIQPMTVSHRFGPER
jgi:hypothetical protein